MTYYGSDPKNIFESNEGVNPSISVRVVIDESSSFRSWDRTKFTFKIDPLESDLEADNYPILTAFYKPVECEIQVERIDKKGVCAGQCLAAKTFSELIALVPDARSIYIANVEQKHTLQIIERALVSSLTIVLDNISDPGPLIKGLLGAGCRRIRPFREKQSSYVGLKAEIK